MRAHDQLASCYFWTVPQTGGSPPHWTDGARQVAQLLFSTLSFRNAIGWQGYAWSARRYSDDGRTPLGLWHTEPVSFGGVLLTEGEPAGRERAVRLECRDASGGRHAHLHYIPFPPDGFFTGTGAMSVTGRAAWLTALGIFNLYCLFVSPVEGYSITGAWSLSSQTTTLNSRRSRLPVEGDPLIPS